MKAILEFDLPDDQADYDAARLGRGVEAGTPGHGGAAGAAARREGAGVSELVSELRLLAGYHMGTDLLERLASAERHQQQQRDALARAADRIEELEAQVANCKPTAPAA